MKHGNLKYPLELQLAVCLGEEKELYSQCYLAKIPKSTKSYWRSKPLNFYLSKMNNLNENSSIKEFLKNKNNELVKKENVISSYLAFVDFIKSAMGSREFISFLNKNKEEFVTFMEGLDPNINKQDLLNIAGVSNSRYYGWKIETQINCTSSPDKICARKRPQKLTFKEVNTIRKLVKTSGGPNKFAIWAKALKDGKIAMGRQTFYNWTKDLKTTKQIRKWKPKRNIIRASKIHQIWHADISVIKIADGSVWYLYCVIDNFSRAIISWSLENCIRKNISAEILYSAYKKYKPNSLKYITDAGSENRNILNTNFPETKMRITHWIAGKNIKSTNALIERVFHTLKNEYGSVHSAASKEQLLEILTKTIKGYMDRPHSQLGIYTPAEVLQNKQGWFDVKKALAYGFEHRLKINRNAICKKCTCDAPIRCLNKNE